MLTLAGEATMQKALIGCQWADRPGLAPCVSIVQEVAGDSPPTFHRCLHPDWVLDYEFIDYGRCRVGSARAPWRARAGATAHLYPPDTPYWEDTRGHRGNRHSAWFCFTGGAEAGLDRLIRLPSRYACIDDHEGQLGEVIRAGVRASRNGPDGFWATQAELCRAIALLLSAAHVSDETYCLSRPDSSIPATLSGRAEQFLREHLPEKITLSGIARALSVSVSSLSHRYRAETGETPMATLARLRIEQARMMLLKGAPMKAVAFQLGFVDAFHFSKVFKRVTGVSPRRFLKGAGR
jgi:AraC-like DNA-binding protein